MEKMNTMTLEYWMDDGWFVGRLREVPGVFSQGQTMDDLEENIREAYRMVKESLCAMIKRQLGIDEAA